MTDELHDHVKLGTSYSMLFVSILLQVLDKKDHGDYTVMEIASIICACLAVMLSKLYKTSSCTCSMGGRGNRDISQQQMSAATSPQPAITPS